MIDVNNGGERGEMGRAASSLPVELLDLLKRRGALSSILAKSSFSYSESSDDHAEGDEAPESREECEKRARA